VEGFRLNLKSHRTLFSVIFFVLIFVILVSAISIVVFLPRGEEAFSELWVLGPGHKAEDYPFNIRAGEQYRVFVGVGNHLGHSADYMVCVKLCNESQPLPAALNPSPSPPLYEFRFSVEDGGNWDAPVDFMFLDASRSDGACFIHRVSINGVVFPINSSSNWDSEKIGFYYQLFFELWLYNETSRSFRYHSRFVGILLNMTC